MAALQFFLSPFVFGSHQNLNCGFFIQTVAVEDEDDGMVAASDLAESSYRSQHKTICSYDKKQRTCEWFLGSTETRQALLWESEAGVQEI